MLPLIRHLARMLFVKLVVQLIHFFPGFLQCPFARGRDLVNAPPAPSNVAVQGLQQPSALQSMQQRVQRTRPDAIAVMRQLLYHCQPEDRLLRSMQ